MEPCTWPISYSSCEGPTCSHLDSLDPVLQESVELMATTWLWAVTNRRFGNCPVTILPCLNGCRNNYGQMWTPFRAAPGSLNWVNVGCGICADTCACSSPSQVTLPTAGTVESVELDGVALDPSAWKVFNSRVLIRTDGGSWPSCQDLTAEPPTWAVTYTPGNPVPSYGEVAAGLLVCEMAKQLCGQPCQLPAGTTSVVRQGVAVSILPTTDARTGIWIVDQWITLVNQAPARVYSPDVRAVRIPADVSSP